MLLLVNIIDMIFIQVNFIVAGKSLKIFVFFNTKVLHVGVCNGKNKEVHCNILGIIY